MIETNSRVAAPYDRFTVEDTSVVRELRVGSLRLKARQPLLPGVTDPKDSWWLGYLRGHKPEPLGSGLGRFRVADLFSGAGGLANGVRRLCDEVGYEMISELVVDQDEEATEVYSANHESRRRSAKSVQQLIEYQIRRTSTGSSFAYPPELLDEDLARALAGLDMALAGPPCQGHSNLNNQTRRNDPRNDLYLTVPAFAVAVGARMCLIENVPTVTRDSQGVVETAQQLFESEGYHVTSGVLSAAEIGWPQTRRRHFLVARKGARPLGIAEIADLLRDEPRSVWWAIADLEGQEDDHLMRQVTNLSRQNQDRIDWLFDNDEHDLDLPERPRSHRDGTTYTAVYGRLKKDLPAPTITTGFTSPGRGRFTHPTRRRTLTPHEAARLQGFPDDYNFVPNPRRPPSRSQLSKWIGDAVPMPLGYAAALAAISGSEPARAPAADA